MGDFIRNAHGLVQGPGDGAPQCPGSPDAQQQGDGGDAGQHDLALAHLGQGGFARFGIDLELVVGKLPQGLVVGIGQGFEVRIRPGLPRSRRWRFAASAPCAGCGRRRGGCLGLLNSRVPLFEAQQAFNFFWPSLIAAEVAATSALPNRVELRTGVESAWRGCEIQFFCVFSRQRMVSCRRTLSCWVMVTMTSLMTCMRRMPMAVSASMIEQNGTEPQTQAGADFDVTH